MNTEETLTQKEFTSTLTLLLTKVQKEILNQGSIFSNNNEEEVHEKLIEVEKFLRLWKKTENKFQLVPTEEISPFFTWLWNNHKTSVLEYLNPDRSTEFGFSKLPLLTQSEKEHHRKNFIATRQLWKQEFGDSWEGKEMSEYSTFDNSFVTHHKGAL